MKITELEFILANSPDAKDIGQFTVRPSVEVLPEGKNGDVRITTSDNHVHLYNNGWKDLGEFNDERMDKVDEIIEDVEGLQLGEYIKKAEAQEVITGLAEDLFVPMSDDDIDNILNGGA